MAASASSLEEDLSCSVCCDVFREPVLLGCGHSFCRECLSRHWGSSWGRLCPVCRTSSPQEPVPNISLRSTCESLLKQSRSESGYEALIRRKKKRKEEGDEEEEEGETGRLCLLHGQEQLFYCDKEEELICSQCKNTRHRGHRVLPLQKAVKERKGRLAAAAKPLRVRLDNLMYGSPESPMVTEHIKTIVEKCETQIRRDFEKLFAFLREEQRTRLEDLWEVGTRETQLAREAIEAEVSLLSERVQEVEEMVQKDDITFLEEFNTVMTSTQLKTPDQVQCPWDKFDVPARLGNLRFNVFKKMQEVIPYYPVILDPSTLPDGMTLSDDLTTVTATAVPQLPNSFSKLVLGPKAFDGDLHTWDVYVGDSEDWVVGVTSRQRLDGTFSLSPHRGFWAVQRKQDEYLALTSPPVTFRPPNAASHVQILRVKLLRAFGQHSEGRIQYLRKVTFTDAQRGLEIFSFKLNDHRGELYPFLCPLGRGDKLRLEPVEVKVEVRETLGFWEKYGPFILFYGCISIIMIVLMKLFNKAERN